MKKSMLGTLVLILAMSWLALWGCRYRGVRVTQDGTTQIVSVRVAEPLETVFARERAPLIMKVEEAPVGATFQWERNGVPIAGGDKPELEIKLAGREDSGIYSCVVESPNHLELKERAKFLPLYTHQINLFVSSTNVVRPPHTGTPLPGTNNALCGGKTVMYALFKNAGTGGYTFTPKPGQGTYAAICLCDPTACVVASPTDGSAPSNGIGQITLTPPLKQGYRFKAFFYSTNVPKSCELNTPGFK